ncbi:hypothetical protein Trydic_g9313 [Trypoxylus dichotomus]
MEMPISRIKLFRELKLLSASRVLGSKGIRVYVPCDDETLENPIWRTEVCEAKHYFVAEAKFSPLELGSAKLLDRRHVVFDEKAMGNTSKR